MPATVKRSTAHILSVLLMVAPVTVYSSVNTLNVGETYESAADIKADRYRTISNLWFTGTGPSENANELIDAITQSDAHGLNPESYQLELLLKELAGLIEPNTASTANTKITKAQIQQLDDSFNRAFRLLAKDLGTGVLNARTTQPGFDRIRPKVNFKSVLSSVRSGNQTVTDALNALSPSAPAYHALVAHMDALLSEQDSAETRTKIAFEPELSLENEQTKQRLQMRLTETGDFETALLNKLESAFTLNRGTLATSELGNISFAHDHEGNFDQLTQALADFQTRHGIKANGELNQETVNALNVTVEQDIKAVALNLERWRWMPRDLGEKHIMINVPAYELTMKNDDQTIVEMDVVVGSKKHRTPIFSEDATIIEVAPSWWIPAKITNKKLIPIELQKPGYFDSKDMDYWKSVDGKLVGVPRSEVTKEDYLKKPFPYLVRQKPGPDNALGNVKILMPNSYAVYMHDTQEKALFDEADRAFSHGCIRLSNPELLSTLLLQLDGFSHEEATDAMDKKVTTRINLKNKVPTHIAYFTAWIDDNGKFHKRKDVYEHNERLARELIAKNTLLSNLTERVVDIDADKDKVVAKN